MFTRVKIKNYKSLVDLDVDFSYKHKKAKPLVVVYGENGVGKSNLASVFYTLSESLRTMLIRNAFQQLLEKQNEQEKNIEEDILSIIKESLSGTESIIKTCKTINSCENMYLQYDFETAEGNKGEYLLEYNDTKIVHEKLDYSLNKNKTNVYELYEDSIKLNNHLFLDEDYKIQFKQLLEKFWGKHTLLSILLFDKEDKAEHYVEERVNPALFEVLDEFMSMSIKVKNGNRGEKGTIGVTHEILRQLRKGIIDIEKEDELDKAEQLVNEFFTAAYSDIKETFYKKEFLDDKIKYSLMFKKLEYDMLVDVDADMESTGTLQLLEIIPNLLMCMENKTVIIDEIDNGIHDLLVNNILNDILDSINGQLIITTHNTMLLDSSIDPEFIYTFNVDRNANKMLKSIIEYEDRKHPNLSYRKRYLQGMYGGVPMSREIDFEELKDIMEE